MKRAKRWEYPGAVVLFLCLLKTTDAALPFKKVSIAKVPVSATISMATTPASLEYETEKEELIQPISDGNDNKSDNSTMSKNSKLTGIPQIDYIWDPNLPRELRGYNLSTYPFLATVPPMDEIHFKCEGLHDGFYASIEYKCQIYHHCVYGIRHDFLCANFTAFDQRTFICHFASDVDCEGSQKYWNRNDELYMATTTTSTSTTTTAAPPIPPRRRPQRPHRKHNRRPVDDYYYDEEEFDDEYYDGRRKHRPRPRKPLLDYDDEYDEKRIEIKPPRRNRNRYRDEDVSDEDYEDHRGRPGRRNKPKGSEIRSKITPRNPARADERRSFNEDRSNDDPQRRATSRRRINEKRTTPSTTDVLDELDEYEKVYGQDQEEAAEEQNPLKVKTTPKPLNEFITPKAAPASVYSRPRAPPRISRPVPINEKKKYSYPVQKNIATTEVPNFEGDEEDDYYQDQIREQAKSDDDYEQPDGNPVRRKTASTRDQKHHLARSSLRKPVIEKKPLLDEEDYYESEKPEVLRHKRPQVNKVRAPSADIDFVDDVDYEESPVRTHRLRYKSGQNSRKSTQRPRKTLIESIEDDQPSSIGEELEDDPAVSPPRSKVVTESPVRRNQKPIHITRQRVVTTSKSTLDTEKEVDVLAQSKHDEPLKDEAEEPSAPALRIKAQRPASVRVVKRPFLPSRGGSPYLPRGLQPVGVAARQLTSEVHTTDNTPIDMGSTISGVRLLEHGAPLLRGEHSSLDNERNRDQDLRLPTTSPPRTTLPPRSALPTSATPWQKESPPSRLNLDELYENDYDVTLNDALDPTLKPLPLQQSQHSNQNQHYNYQSRPYGNAFASPVPSAAYNAFTDHNNNYQETSIYQNHSPSSSIPSASQTLSQSQPTTYHSDSYFSSTDIRQRAVVPSQISRSHRNEYSTGRAVSTIQVGQRPNKHVHKEFKY